MHSAQKPASLPPAPLSGARTHEEERAARGAPGHPLPREDTLTRGAARALSSPPAATAAGSGGRKASARSRARDSKRALSTRDEEKGKASDSGEAAGGDAAADGEAGAGADRAEASVPAATHGAGSRSRRQPKPNAPFGSAEPADAAVPRRARSGARRAAAKEDGGGNRGNADGADKPKRTSRSAKRAPRKARKEEEAAEALFSLASLLGAANAQLEEERAEEASKKRDRASVRDRTARADVVDDGGRKRARTEPKGRGAKAASRGRGGTAGRSGRSSPEQRAGAEAKKQDAAAAAAMPPHAGALAAGVAPWAGVAGQAPLMAGGATWTAAAPGAPYALPSAFSKQFKRCATHVYIAHMIDHQQQAGRRAAYQQQYSAGMPFQLPVMGLPPAQAASQPDNASTAAASAAAAASAQVNAAPSASAAPFAPPGSAGLPAMSAAQQQLAFAQQHLQNQLALGAAGGMPFMFPQQMAAAQMAAALQAAQLPPHLLGGLMPGAGAPGLPGQLPHMAGTSQVQLPGAHGGAQPAGQDEAQPAAAAEQAIASEQKPKADSGVAGTQTPDAATNGGAQAPSAPQAVPVT